MMLMGAGAAQQRLTSVLSLSCAPLFRVGIHESQKIDKVRAQWIFRYNDYIK